jgi:hypothetical protein
MWWKEEEKEKKKRKKENKPPSLLFFGRKNYFTKWVSKLTLAALIEIACKAKTKVITSLVKRN